MPIEVRAIGIIGFWILAEIAIAVMRKIVKDDKTIMTVYILWVNFIVILMTLYFIYIPL